MGGAARKLLNRIDWRHWRLVSLARRFLMCLKRNRCQRHTLFGRMIKSPFGPMLRRRPTRKAPPSKWLPPLPPLWPASHRQIRLTGSAAISHLRPACLFRGQPVYIVKKRTQPHRLATFWPPRACCQIPRHNINMGPVCVSPGKPPQKQRGGNGTAIAGWAGA